MDGQHGTGVRAIGRLPPSDNGSRQSSGYVVKDHETTTRFLRTGAQPLAAWPPKNFFGGMAHNAHANGLTLAFETAFGDILPGDILEYYKYADVPMCEFWRHPSDTFVGSINFKPIKPTASAARLYGKPRVAAESFTSFQLTWDEHLSRMREAANQNAIEGVTHNVLHTYTHNPRTDFLPPGTSFGSNIGNNRSCAGRHGGSTCLNSPPT